MPNAHKMHVRRMPLKFSLCQLVILLLSVEFSTVSCDTFYIVISPSSPCPGEYIGVPCLTLQQYASNPSQSQNITLLIEPETYDLATVLTVSDGYNFTMSSTNAAVICTSSTAKFEFNRVENVYISGMTFQGCRNGAAVQISIVTGTVVVRNDFNRNNGAALRMSSVLTAIVLRNNFTENQGNCLHASSSSVIISESKFYDNGRANYYTGRAISVSNSMVMINKSLFSNNTAYCENGGAIYTT